jgi:MFS family permease
VTSQSAFMVTSLLRLGKFSPPLACTLLIIYFPYDGRLFSCPSAGYLADRYGRRFAIVVGCLVFVLGGSLQTSAQSVDMMMTGISLLAGAFYTTRLRSFPPSVLMPFKRSASRGTTPSSVAFVAFVPLAFCSGAPTNIKRL